MRGAEHSLSSLQMCEPQREAHSRSGAPETVGPSALLGHRAHEKTITHKRTTFGKRVNAEPQNVVIASSTDRGALAYAECKEGAVRVGRVVTESANRSVGIGVGAVGSPHVGQSRSDSGPA